MTLWMYQTKIKFLFNLRGTRMLASFSVKKFQKNNCNKLIHASFLCELFTFYSLGKITMNYYYYYFLGL